MATPKAATSSQQSIEHLQQRYNLLNTQKIQAETKLEAARNQLEDLKREAREKYGTDDVTALQAKLDAMRTENEQKRAAYQAQLDSIESALAAVEQRFVAAETATEKAAP